MLLVDVDRGKREGMEMAKELEGQQDSEIPPSYGDGTIRLIDEEDDTRRESRS